jgi:hypothetical protein
MTWHRPRLPPRKHLHRGRHRYRHRQRQHRQLHRQRDSYTDVLRDTSTAYRTSADTSAATAPPIPPPPPPPAEIRCVPLPGEREACQCDINKVRWGVENRAAEGRRSASQQGAGKNLTSHVGKEEMR